jgi:hypothetical protein
MRDWRISQPECRKGAEYEKFSKKVVIEDTSGISPSKLIVSKTGDFDREYRM